MNARITFSILVIILLLAAGQLLFKATAIQWSTERTLLSVKVLACLVPALAMYGLATISWIWILRRVSLQFAYPFMALTFVLVPIGSYVLFGERANIFYYVGVAIIICGVIVVVLST